VEPFAHGTNRVTFLLGNQERGKLMTALPVFSSVSILNAKFALVLGRNLKVAQITKISLKPQIRNPINLDQEIFPQNSRGHKFDKTFPQNG
jgi:hypothetical protein